MRTVDSARHTGHGRLPLGMRSTPQPNTKMPTWNKCMVGFGIHANYLRHGSLLLVGYVRSLSSPPQSGRFVVVVVTGGGSVVSPPPPTPRLVFIIFRSNVRTTRHITTIPPALCCTINTSAKVPILKNSRLIFDLPNLALTKFRFTTSRYNVRNAV